MTFAIAASWTPRDGAGEEVAAILRELVRRTRAEEGCLMFVVHRAQADPSQFFLYEQYRSEQDWLDHQQTAHFKELVLERALPLLQRRERLSFVVMD